MRFTEMGYLEKLCRGYGGIVGRLEKVRLFIISGVTVGGGWVGGCGRAFAVVGMERRSVRFAREGPSSEVQWRMCGGRRWRRWERQ